VAEARTITLPVEDVLLLHHAAAMAVQLYDAVEAEPGNKVPTHAPVYGKRDRLLELARQLDHTANCESPYVGEFELHGGRALRRNQGGGES